MAPTNPPGHDVSSKFPVKQILTSPWSKARLLIPSLLAAALCAATAQAQSQQQTSGDESWSTTRDNAPQYANPSRTTESHTKTGNRTVDKQRTEVLGPNGGYQPSMETEAETIQVDANTTRTVVRTYRWNGGQRTLARVSEQESHATSNGGVRTERKISTSDVNGNFQLVRREVADTKTVSPGIEETKGTAYQRDSYGGFTQAEQTDELTTHSADDSVSVKKTTRLPDGNGGWKVGGVTEKVTKADGKDRTTEERVSLPDFNGRLQESSRTVSKEGENAAGEKTTTVEGYSVLAPAYTDGAMHLNQRTTTVQKKTSTGETTEERIEQLSLGNPSDGARVNGRTHYTVQYAAPGSQQPTQQSRTAETRDASGNFRVVSTESQKSTQPGAQAPPKPKPAAPSTDKPAEKPPVKP